MYTDTFFMVRGLAYDRAGHIHSFFLQHNQSPENPKDIQAQTNLQQAATWRDQTSHEDTRAIIAMHKTVQVDWSRATERTHIHHQDVGPLKEK